MSSGHIERSFDRVIQVGDLVRIARAHEPFQAVARDCQDVVEIRNATHGQALASTECYLRWKLPDCSRYERNYDPTNTV